MNQPQPIQTDDVLDAAAVIEARTMMLDKFPRLVEFFLEDATIYIGKIEEGLIARNAQLIVPPAHTLKSSARQMGAAKLADVAMHIETEARKALSARGTIEHLAPDISALKTLLAQTRAALQQFAA